MIQRESIIVTVGDFDDITYDDLQILKACKLKGDWLVVGVHSDEYLSLSGRKLKNNYRERKELVESVCFVDEVFTFNDIDGTSCNLLRIIKMCYPISNIIYVSEKGMENMPEYRIRGIKFAVIK